MKKLISLITGGMLAAMPLIPLTITAEAKAFSANESEVTDTSIISNTPDSEEIQEVTTQAPPKTDELRAIFSVDKPYYDVYVGEQIDLSDIILNLNVWGYLPDGKFQTSTTLLNYSFSIGSGKHSDCYTFDMSSVDTSKAGEYLINCKLNGGFKTTFDIENSGSTDVPDGKYDMVMQDGNFYIHINVIDPNVTEPPYTGITTTTYANCNICSYPTTALTDESQAVTTQAPPAEGEIRAVYTCQETYNVNVGEKFNPDDIELSVYAWSAIPNQYQIDYKFTIGSGKHSDCFTYDASEIDTSKPGTYYVWIKIIPNVKDIYMIDSSNSYNVPYGEYEMVTQDVPMFSAIPVFVVDPNVTEPPYTGMTTTTVNSNIICVYPTTSVDNDEYTGMTTTTVSTHIICEYPTNDISGNHDDNGQTTTTVADAYGTESSSSITPGDANDDGLVDIADATAIIQHMGNTDEYALSEQGKANADIVNQGDGVTGADAVALQLIEAKKITQSELPLTMEQYNALISE